MHYLKLALGTALGVAFAASASAQTVGIGSTKAGAVAQITATMSKVISSHGEGIQMRSQTMGGTQQYIPVINAGELEFGIANVPQYIMATSGTGLSEGNKYDNLRLVSTMMVFSTGLVVPNNIPAKTVAEMKGMRLAAGFKAAPLFAYFVQAAIASEGLTYKDFTEVPTVGLVQSWNAMMEGKVDGVIAALGTGFLKQMNAAIPGGVRYISIKNTPESLAAINKILPRVYLQEFKPDPKNPSLTGVVGPANLMSYDFTFFTHKGMSDEIVYKVTKIMHKHAAELKEGGPLWKTYPTDANMAKDHGVAYHPGAVKYYKEAGFMK